MFNKHIKRLTILSIIVLSLIIVGCTSDNDEDTTESESVAESLDYTIVGIEAGAGLMQLTEDMMEDYGLDNYTLQPSSGIAMTQALGDAIENEEPVVVTGWAPHWKLQAYDVKFLEDPRDSFGEGEVLITLARHGLQEDMPDAYEVLSNFQWSMSDIESVMLDIAQETPPEVAARDWVENNPDMVNQWIGDARDVDGDEIGLAHTPWDSEIASHNVMKVVLEDLGYDVTLTQVDFGPVFYGLAGGTIDASLSAWLPTYQDYYDDYIDEIDDLGVNLEDAVNGLVVPSYMDIDSIEDLVE